MMSNNPLRKKPETGKPRIWAEGDQRPPFRLGATGRAALFLSREGVAPLLGWLARRTRQVAVNVKNGVGRIPEQKLGRAARFVPSHLRVAGWIKNTAAILSHASATADTDIKRGNALVIEIEPHLWDTAVAPPRAPEPEPEAEAEPVPQEVAPIVLAEPEAKPYDPLASIRDKLAKQPDIAPDETVRASAPDQPPAPPGQLAVTAIQMSGYALGWATTVLALPYGLARALWLYAKGVDLRGVGQDG